MDTTTIGSSTNSRTPTVRITDLDTSGQRSLFYVGDTKQCLYLCAIVTTAYSTTFRHSTQTYGAIHSRSPGDPLRRFWMRSTKSSKTHSLSPIAFPQTPPRVATSMAKPSSGRAEPRPQRLRLLDRGTKGRSAKPQRAHTQPTHRAQSHRTHERVPGAQEQRANDIADYLRENTSLPVHTGSAVQAASDNAAGSALDAATRRSPRSIGTRPPATDRCLHLRRFTRRGQQRATHSSAQRKQRALRALGCRTRT